MIHLGAIIERFGFTMNVMGGFPGEAKSGYNYTTDHREGEVVGNYSNTRHQNEHKGVCFRNFSEDPKT